MGVVAASSNGETAGRPLHVLAVGIRWPPETFIRSKLERLPARGLRVTVATSGRAAKSALLLPGVVVETVLPPRARGRFAVLRAAVVAGFRLRRRLRWCALVRAASQPTASGRRVSRREALERLSAYAQLAASQPDVVHFEWISAADHYYSVIDALGRPVVLSCRGSEVNVNPHTSTYRQRTSALPLAFARASAVACVSEAIRTEAQRYGLDPAKARVVRAGVDLDFFHPPPAPRPVHDGFRLVAVGLLRWLKGWEYALLAVAQLAREGVPVSIDVFGGDPPPDMALPSERRRLLYTIDDLGLRSRVAFHDDVPPSRLRDALQRGDALLHSSLSEGLPNVVLEAMACGLPVVATDVGGTSEAVTDGVEGFLVPPRDPRAAAVALARLWRDPSLREQMGAAGRHRVEREFGLDSAIERWADVYRDVLRDGRGL